MIMHKDTKIKLRGIVRRVYKKTGRAISDYSMLSDKDRILVGVSGGKDSLSLLKALLMRRDHVPIDFELIPCFVDVEFGKSYRDKIEKVFKQEGLTYVVKSLNLDKTDINCFWCSWNKRKELFRTAREYNCNKIALAHHLDDIVETVLMNLFLRGEISSMKPKVELFGGEVSV